MFNKRMTGLLNGVADDLAQATQPLSREFLANNNVTLDECYSVAENAGLVLHGFLRAPRKLQMQIMAIGALGDCGVDPAVLAAEVDATLTRKEVFKKLEEAGLERE